jgi:hypothetical protein
MLRRQRSFRVRNPGILTIRRTFETRCGINRESAGKNHLRKEETTGGRGFRELPAHIRGIHPRKRIPPGITNLFTQIESGKIKTSEKSFEQ